MAETLGLRRHGFDGEGIVGVGELYEGIELVALSCDGNRRSTSACPQVETEISAAPLPHGAARIHVYLFWRLLWDE